MSEEPRQPEHSVDSAPVAEPEWKRKARLARIFGDSLPETTSDERDSSDRPESSSSDEWLKSQVPPHHGE